MREGDTVAAGQLLATLDATFAKADVGQLRQQIAGLYAQIARLTAEKERKPLAFDQDANPDEVPFFELQTALYAQRAAGYAAQMRAFDEKVKASQAIKAKLQNDITRYTSREDITRQIEGMRETLFKIEAAFGFDHQSPSNPGKGGLGTSLTVNHGGQQNERLPTSSERTFSYSATGPPDLGMGPTWAREPRSAQRWNVLIFLALRRVDVRSAEVNFGGCDAGGELRPLSVQREAQV